MAAVGTSVVLVEMEHGLLARMVLHLPETTNLLPSR